MPEGFKILHMKAKALGEIQAPFAFELTFPTKRSLGKNFPAAFSFRKTAAKQEVVI